MSTRNTTNYLELLWRALRARLGGTASPSSPCVLADCTPCGMAFSYVSKSYLHAHAKTRARALKGIRGIKNSYCCLRSNRVGKLCRTHKIMSINFKNAKYSLQNEYILHFIEKIFAHIKKKLYLCNVN